MTESKSTSEAAASNPAGAHRPARLRVTGKAVLGVLLLSIIAAPFLVHTEAGVLIEGLIITTVLAAGVASLGGSRRTLVIAAALAVPAVAARWLNFAWPEWVPSEVYLVLAVLAMAYVAWQFLRFIMLTKRVDSNVLCTGIASFLLVAMLWSFIYQLIALQVPGSFTFTFNPPPPGGLKGMMAMYFSMVTLCTVGFGDIVPVSDIARMAAMLEGAAGVFFVAVMISRLVSLYTVEHQDQGAGERH
jgi:hypothetical protein